MALHHVTHLPGFIKVTPAPFNPHFFRHRDLDVVDGTGYPSYSQTGIGKTQRQQVQYRFFAEIMVDAVNLALFKIFRYFGIDRP